MRRLFLAVPLCAVLIMAGCGKKEGADAPKAAAEGAGTSPEAVQSQMAQMVKPRPGLYKTTMKVIKFEIPGMPAAQSERLKGMFSSAGTEREMCMTAAMSENGYRDYAKNLGQGNCTVEHFNADGGSIDSAMTCQTSRGQSAKIAMTGTVTPESSTIHMKMEQKLPAGAPAAMGAVNMEMEVTSQRTGDCAS